MNSDDPSEPSPELFRPRPAPVEIPGLTVTLEKVQQDALDFRTLLHATFAALIFLALGVNLFLWKQMRMASDELNEYRGQMERADVQFLKQDPEFKRIVMGLQQYASTHPDYGEILGRYRGVLSRYLPTAPALSLKPDPVAPSTAPASR